MTRHSNVDSDVQETSTALTFLGPFCLLVVVTWQHGVVVVAAVFCAGANYGDVALFVVHRCGCHWQVAHN